MSELVSAYPTSGGIYWWASKARRPEGRLLHRLAEPDRAARHRRLGRLRLRDLLRPHARRATARAGPSGYTLDADVRHLHRRSWSLVALVNIFSSHLLAIINNISVWWHVVGAAVVILILVFVPDHHADVSDVFTETVNNTRLLRRARPAGPGSSSTSCRSASCSPSTRSPATTPRRTCRRRRTSAANAAAKGIWRSIFYSAIGGWILLLAFLFAVQDADEVDQRRRRRPGDLRPGAEREVGGIDAAHLDRRPVLLHDRLHDELDPRMLFAFSRDGAVPGCQLLVEAHAQPRAGQRRHPRPPSSPSCSRCRRSSRSTSTATPRSPVAFFAVVSIGVIGLYVAFAIPIWLPLAAGRAFRQGPGTSGTKWKWMAPLAVAEIVITSIYFLMPLPAGAPGFMRGCSARRAPPMSRSTGSSSTTRRSSRAAHCSCCGSGGTSPPRSGSRAPSARVDLPAGVTASEEIALEHGHHGYLTGEHDPS